MATDREAARRQRLRGAQTRDVVDADTSFGFRLPGAATTVIAAETTTAEAQIATPTPAANPRRGGRQGIGGTKRSSPTLDTENNAPDVTEGPQDGSTRLVDQNEQLAKRQRRAEPKDDSTARAQGRNQRLRGAQLRSPGVGVQDFGFILPDAPAAPSIATTDTEIQPADFSTSAAPEAPEDTAAPRETTPEIQILAETTNTSIRSSGSRSLRSSARRNRANAERTLEVSESPKGRPGSGRRVRVPIDRARSETSNAAEAAARRLNDVVGTPTRAGRGSLGREASPTLTVEKPRQQDEEARDPDEDVEMDELSPDRPKAQHSTPRHSGLDQEDVSQGSVRESIEEKDDAEEQEEASPVSDTAAAAALRRNRAPRSSYVEKRPDQDLDEDDEASDQYEESADENADADADTLTAAQQRKRLAGLGRKNKSHIDSPAVQKLPKNKTAARTATAQPFDAPRKRGRPKGSKNNTTGKTKTKRQDMGPKSRETIAVQTYRLSVYNPPPELEAEGDEELEDVLVQPIPFPNLPRATGGVNSIDVLSQILNEVLQSALESLEQGAARADEAAARRPTPEKAAERREYRTKLRAVEAWGEAAGGALMEMGLGLDAAVASTKRARELERERVELRERLGEIRRERERVGVRGDAVRGRHEREGGEREKGRRLQDAIEGVGVAVGVCREAGNGERDGEEGRADVVERIKEVREMVGSGSVGKDGEEGGVALGGEGLLQRLRRLNGLLERAAGALEGR